MKIKHKLFIIILCVTAVVLFANFVMARWSFDQSFRQFVNGMEERRLSPLKELLLQSYVDNDYSWNHVKDIGLEQLVLKSSEDSHNSIQHSSPFLPPPHRGRPGPPPFSSFKFRPDMEGNTKREVNDEIGRERRGQPPSHIGPDRRLVPGLDGPPTALFDADGLFISGASHPQLSNNPSSIDSIYIDEELIGELRSLPRVDSPSPLLDQFSFQALKGALFVGLFSLLVGAGLAWWAAKRFTEPLEKVKQGVADLASGEYELTFNEDRGDEIGSVMENLEYLAMALEKNRSSKQRFFADISHELRTPLTILSGEVEVLKAGIRQFDSKQLESFSHEISRLRHLVDDLHQLSISDMGGLKYHFEKNNVSECLRKSLESLQFKAKEKGLKMEYLISPEVYSKVDIKRLEQLFLNLCQNSITYTDAPGTIRFDLRLNKDIVTLTVDDTAPSVGMEECKLLTEPLYRQDKSRTRSEAGSGLGLAICKNIVDAHHGSMDITPSELGGIRTVICFASL